MSILSKVKIRGIGGCVPAQKLTNDDLAKIVDTNDEWITTRTGIKERRKAQEDEGCLDLAVGAVQDLVQQGYQIDDVDLIVVATMTPDYFTPSVSAQLQGRLGLGKNVQVIDINAACAGFMQAIQVANSLITVGQNKKALVIGVETLTKITDYTDRTTCILFGDGAGAVLMEASEDQGLFAVHYGADGISGEKLYCTNFIETIGADKTPVEKAGTFVQDGRAVYNFVSKAVPAGMKALAEKSGISLDELDWFVPHSANLRMIQFIASILKIPMEKVLVSLPQFGNTSAASIPLALWLARREGQLKDGDLIGAYGFGGGLNHSGAFFRWYE